MSKNNFILYDIETKDKVNVELDKYDNPFNAKVGEGLVTSIAMINLNTGGERVETIGLNGITSQQDLLDAVEPLFKNKHNVLIAWNGNGFDDPIMIKKLGLKQSKCCKFFDLMKGYSKFVKYESKNYALSDIAMEVGSFKDDVNPVEAFHNGELELLAEYNLQDVRAMQEIDNKYNIINTAQELKDIVGLEDYSRLFTVTKPLESFINKESFKLGSNNTKSFSNFGGLNYFKNTGLYSNLKHFDVKSFYPFMMLALEGSSNLNYREVKQEFVKEVPSDLIELEKDKFYISKDGLTQCKWDKHRKEYVLLHLSSKFNVNNGNGDIKKIIEPLFNLKDTASDKYKRQAYKTLINGLYGALDSKYFDYQHRRLSATTTFLCRYVLWNCINHFDGVYAKTDSIWTTNTSLTEAELNDFSNKLLSDVGLPAPNIQWELENSVDKLVVKDKNNYIEVINGETYFKGSFPYPVQQLVLEEAINNPTTIDINSYLDKYSNDISLFCEHTNLSSKQSNHLKFNTSLSELNNYEYLSDWKNYIYCSEYGYLHSTTVDKFTLPVNKDFAKAIINNILFDWNLLPSDKPSKRLNFNSYWKKVMIKPKFVPMYLGKDNRFVQDNKAIGKILDVKVKKYDNTKANSIILTNDPEFKYNGLVLGGNYFAVDIDRKDFGDSTDKVKDTIVALFNKNQYVLQSTKSNGYHIIFKTSNKDIFKIPTNSNNPDYKGLELKVKAILPYNNTINDELKYEVVYGDINKLKNFNQIGKLADFYGEMKTLTNLDNFKDCGDNSDYNVTFNGDFNNLNTVIVDIAKEVDGNTHDFCIALGTALKGNVSNEEANIIFKEVTNIIGTDKNKLGTLKQFFNNADGNNKSYGRLITYMKQNGLKQHIRSLDAVTGNNKITPIKTKIINNSKTKAKGKVYAEVVGSRIGNGQIMWLKKVKDGMESITMFNCVFFNLEVKEDINGLVKPIYTLNVERKGADDLTFTGSLKDIKQDLFTYSLVFTGEKDQNIMKYLQRAFTSDNGTCVHVKENLTGGYVNTAMLPDKAPSKDKFMEGWNLFIEIWEALPEIHKKCMLALIVGNFKYIIISNAIGDTRLIARAVFLYGTSNSMKTTLVELVKGMFKLTENVLPLGSEVNSPDTPVSLMNELASNCGLVLVDDNDTIFAYPNSVAFEKVIKSTENMNLPLRTDMQKGVGNNRESKNLGCPVITSNKPKINILDKQSILKRSYVFNFIEEFSLSEKLGRNIKPSEVNKLQSVGLAIAYALRDIDWENLPYNYGVNDLVNHIFSTIAKIYDVDTTPVVDIEVSNEFSPATIGERVNAKFINKYKTNWKNYVEDLDDPTELPFIFENKKGYWIQTSTLYDYVRDFLNDGGMSKSTMLKELGLDEIKSKNVRFNDSTKSVLDKQYSKGDLGKLFS